MVLIIRDEAVGYGSLGSVPQNMQANVRNQMYLTSETMRLLPKFGPKMSEQDVKPIENYKGFLDRSTKYIPTWVKVAVALALGLGTMVGWKRIVVTVGEKIGKTHLTYAQGAAAELVAALYHLWLRPRRPARLHDARSLIRRRGNHGRERQWVCRCPRCATSPWRGSSPCPRRRCSQACSTSYFDRIAR